MTGATVLIWRILDDNTHQFGGVVIYVSSSGSPVAIGGVFNVEHLSSVGLPIVSNISFTAQSSINGYNIRCEDGSVAQNLIVSGVLCFKLSVIILLLL